MKRLIAPELLLMAVAVSCSHSNGTSRGYPAVHRNNGTGSKHAVRSNRQWNIGSIGNLVDGGECTEWCGNNRRCVYSTGQSRHLPCRGDQSRRQLEIGHSGRYRRRRRRWNTADQDGTVAGREPRRGRPCRAPGRKGLDADPSFSRQPHHPRQLQPGQRQQRRSDRGTPDEDTGKGDSALAAWISRLAIAKERRRMDGSPGHVQQDWR